MSLIKLIAVHLKMPEHLEDRAVKYLALGDSYTIGELLPEEHNFPHLVQKQLQGTRAEIGSVQVIAKTGWTTDELIGPMEMEVHANDYNWVSLLIGVNNQYRGRSANEYKVHFEYLCSRALHYAAGQASRVIVLSIPDWGMTPFNTDRDKQQTSKEIDIYNAVNKAVALQWGFHYIDITPSTRENAHNTNYLASDLLHPSALEYEIWAKQVAAIMLETH
jgi:lysophospholipase L1-like esterase